jgi:TrmH family RNA methyltransferase
MRTEQITSFQNPKVKNLLLLQEKSSARREQGLFVVEGRRELEHCIEAGYKVRTVFYCPEIAGTAAGNDVEASFSGLSRESLVIEVPAALYRKIAYREGTEGIMAEVEAKQLSLTDLQLPENPLIVVLEAVEKPGNLGAVLRSADAAGASAVIVCDPLTDLYNPNLIRASIGAVFTVPVVAASSAEVIQFLKGRGIAILTAQLQDSSLYYDTDMRRGVAIVMGTESTGLTSSWREAADAHIRIPMLGRLDSLNVSVSAAILLFEAVRQRQI